VAGAALKLTCEEQVGLVARGEAAPDLFAVHAQVDDPAENLSTGLMT